MSCDISGRRRQQKILNTLGVIAWDLVSAALWLAGTLPFPARAALIAAYVLSLVPMYPPFFWRQRVQWAAIRGCGDLKRKLITKRFEETNQEIKLGGTVDFIAGGRRYQAHYT